MASRSHESPMDFQWETPHNAAANSPFSLARLQSSLHQQSPTPAPNNQRMDIDDEPPRKRPHNDLLGSPVKSIPALRTPQRQSVLFGTPSKPGFNSPLPPPSSFRSPSTFTTPARSSALSFGPISDEFMSSPEVPNSPGTDTGADTEETPEPRRKSFSTPHRSGRGLIPRGSKYTDRIVNRVHKKRARKEKEFLRQLHDEDLFSTDGEDSSDDIGKPRFRDKAATWAETHREVPLILSHYLQLGINFVLVGAALFLAVYFALAIKADVNKRIETYSADMLAEMSLCSKEYITNRCSPDMRLPALEERCTYWEKCMNRDPREVGRARVGAETFAVILNSFIEPISYKSMFFVSILLFGTLAMSNIAFGFFRAKAAQHPQPFLAAAAPPIFANVASSQSIDPSTWATPAPVQNVGGPIGMTPKRPGMASVYNTPATSRRRAVDWR